MGDGKKQNKRSNLYQNQVVKHIESFYEDKFTDLEKKRNYAEDKFKITQADKFYTDYQYHLGEDKKRGDGVQSGDDFKGANIPNQGS